jgi:hypothetical protein
MWGLQVFFASWHSAVSIRLWSIMPKISLYQMCYKERVLTFRMVALSSQNKILRQGPKRYDKSYHHVCFSGIKEASKHICTSRCQQGNVLTSNPSAVGSTIKWQPSEFDGSGVVRAQTLDTCTFPTEVAIIPVFDLTMVLVRRALFVNEKLQCYVPERCDSSYRNVCLSGIKEASKYLPIVIHPDVSKETSSRSVRRGWVQL